MESRRYGQNQYDPHEVHRLIPCLPAGRLHPSSFILSVNTPSAVLNAFSPGHPLELTLEGLLVLESIGTSYLTGGKTGFRDAALVWLAMTDLPGLKAARRAGTVEEMLEAWGSSRRPADFLAMEPIIARAIAAAFAPAADPETLPDADGGEESGLPEKKPVPA